MLQSIPLRIPRILIFLLLLATCTLLPSARAATNRTPNHDKDKDAGLIIETTVPVAAKDCTRKTHNDDVIHVNYRGTLTTGEEFDSSYGRGEPFVFPLGHHRVIAGWDRGLLDMCVGEHRRLTIPPELAYGLRGMGKIPPNSTLGTLFEDCGEEKGRFLELSMLWNRETDYFACEMWLICGLSSF